MKNGSRIALILTGGLSALIAAALLAGGAFALVGEIEKEDDGYLTSETHRFEADTRALTTGNLDLDLGDADWLVETDALGSVKVSAESREDKELFVGIARTSDVQRYLGNVPHTTVDDVETSPFDADLAPTDVEYTRHSGERRPEAPEHAGIWAASNQGDGRQSIEWKVEEGEWSVVVMNADGSVGVDADISAGADLPFLNEIGWTALGSGSIALAIGLTLIVLGARRPNDPSGTAPVGDAAPAAA
jgi:hypothetical protein